MRVVGAIVLGCVLTACAGTNQVNYYQLSNIEPSSAVEVVKSSAVGVIKVNLADAINSSSLVYQTQPNQVVLARDNLWASTPQQAITDYLIREMNQGSAGLWLSQYAGKPERLLQVQIDQFQGRYDGVAVLSGRWVLLNADNQVIASSPFSMESKIPKDGYSAMVSALSEDLHQLAASLIKQVNQ